MTRELLENRFRARKAARKSPGSARYVDDLTFPGMLYGVTVRSPWRAGESARIHFGGGVPWNEFTIVTAKDIPGKNCVALLIEDQPCLADRIVNHPEEAGRAAGASRQVFAGRGAPRGANRRSNRCPAFSRSKIRWRERKSSGAQDNIFKSF